MARIVFMGTPEFAVPVLDALTQTAHKIVGVYTRPDQPAGRGKQVRSSPIKQLAAERALPVFQPPTLRKSEFVVPLRELAPDVIVVAAYGLILPPEVLAIPPRGCVNTHASLLPRHRGAAPIAAAILSGDPETGITLMQMDVGLDSGPILAQRAFPISNEDTTGTLTPKLADLAALLLIDMLPRVLAGDITPQIQNETHATYQKMIRKEDGRIDWTRSAIEIERHVRAFNPWPSTYTFWNKTQLKLLRARAKPSVELSEPGRVIEWHDEIAVTTGDGALVLYEVQLAGKRAMKIEEFIRGKRDLIGSSLDG